MKKLLAMLIFSFSLLNAECTYVLKTYQLSQNLDICQYKVVQSHCKNTKNTTMGFKTISRSKICSDFTLPLRGKVIKKEAITKEVYTSAKQIAPLK